MEIHFFVGLNVNGRHLDISLAIGIDHGKRDSTRQALLGKETFMVLYSYSRLKLAMLHYFGSFLKYIHPESGFFEKILMCK